MKVPTLLQWLKSLRSIRGPSLAGMIAGHQFGRLRMVAREDQQDTVGRPDQPTWQPDPDLAVCTQTWLSVPYCSPSGKSTDFHKPDSFSHAWALPVQLFQHLFLLKCIYYTEKNNNGAGSEASEAVAVASSQGLLWKRLYWEKWCSAQPGDSLLWSLESGVTGHWPRV